MSDPHDRRMSWHKKVWKVDVDDKKRILKLLLLFGLWNQNIWTTLMQETGNFHVYDHLKKLNSGKLY